MRFHFNKMAAVLLSAVMLIGIVGAFPAKSLGEDAELPTLTVDMSKGGRSLKHGSSGWLYGLGDRGVPSASLLTPLKAHTTVQKAPHGMQHPNGDVLDVAKTFTDAGGKNIQIYVPDYYALWGYEFTGTDEYMEILRMQAESCIKEGIAEDVSYVLYNEPGSNWVGAYHDDQGNRVTGWNSMFWFWKDMVEMLREVYKEHNVPTAPKTVGLNLAAYQESTMTNFLRFCIQHDVLPDIISWHSLGTEEFKRFPKEYTHYRQLEETLGLEEKDIVINEYAWFNECGAPGRLVRWIGLMEEYNIAGCMPYWHLSNNLNGLAADTNEGNGAWWLFKWYGDMSGDYLPVTTSNALKEDFYGAASIDNNKKVARFLFGGELGAGNIVLDNITDTETFENATKVHIKLETTDYTGFHGAADEPCLIKEGALEVVDGTVTIPMTDMNPLSGYFLTITRADESEAIGLEDKTFRKTIEAETGTRAGTAGVSTDGQYVPISGVQVAAGGGLNSADARGHVVSGLNSANARVTFTFQVPQSGYYKYEMIYGSGNGINTQRPELHHPLTAKQTLAVNEAEEITMTLPTTLGRQNGIYSTYVYLDAGENSLRVSGTSSRGKADIDCIYLTYIGEKESDTGFHKVYEAELGDFNMLTGNDDTTLTTLKEGAVSYVGGLEKRKVTEGGGLRYTVVVPENGMYKLGLKYQAAARARANIYIDNDAVHLDNLRTSCSLPVTGQEWGSVYRTVFLQKGVNIIDIDSEGAIKLDSMQVAVDEDSTPIDVIEAESCLLTGEAEIGNNGDVNTYASDNSYVSGIKAANGVELIPREDPAFTVQGLGRALDFGEAADKNSLKMEVNVPEAGNYKLVVHQSSGELFGRHDYNYQMVERYASFSVNGGPGKKTVFRNTYSDERFKTHVVDVTLKKGDNIITVYNDNTKINTNGVLKPGTTEHRPENIDYGILENRTPNFDKFELYADHIYVYEEPEPTPTPVPEPEKVDISKMVCSSIHDQNYTGKAVTPGLVITHGSKTLVQDRDYSLAYQDNIRMGTASVLVTGKGDYIGSITKTFKIIAVKGKTYKVGNHKYKVRIATAKTKTVSLVNSVKKTSTSVTIPKTIRLGAYQYKVSEIGANAFKNHTRLRKVTIGTNVRKIGKNAFSGARNLRNIKINSRILQSVGTKAFQKTYPKVSIKVPKNRLNRYQKLFRNKIPKTAVVSG